MVERGDLTKDMRSYELSSSVQHRGVEYKKTILRSSCNRGHESLLDNT